MSLKDTMTAKYRVALFKKTQVLWITRLASLAQFLYSALNAHHVIKINRNGSKL
jgi:hypothetical protein